MPKKPDTVRVLTIDPSIKKLGWAVFAHGVNTVRYECSGLLRYSKDWEHDDPNHPEWISRVDSAVEDVEKLVILHRPVRMLIEQPDIWASGRGEGANNSGSILKLFSLVISLRQRRVDATPLIITQLVPVKKWKGTVPKKITQRRILKHWGISMDDVEDHNEMDAVGIGDWYFRKFMNFTIIPHRAA